MMKTDICLYIASCKASLYKFGSKTGRTGKQLPITFTDVTLRNPILNFTLNTSSVSLQLLSNFLQKLATIEARTLDLILVKIKKTREGEYSVCKMTLT
jgi:hypothetical protein